VASPFLLRRLDAKLTCVNCNPAGRFGRPSEPLEEYLGYIGNLVRAGHAAGAVIHDGDADRMMAFDNRGRYISGDRLLMLFTLYLDAREVVTTYDASMAIEEIATVRRTPVGDTYVSAELASWGRFGGEPSGAWIFPDHSLCPDGPYAAALYAEIAREWDIAAEIDRMPAYPVLRESLPCDDAGDVMRRIGAASPTDGIRLSGEDGWCLIRASGTEPKIRLTAEGTDRKAAESMLSKGRSLLKTRKSA
jgi:phosphoglucosamine mutase